VRLELQRLLARGTGCLPRDVVVDVGAFVRAVAGDVTGHSVWKQLTDAARRSGRTFTWVLSPTTMSSAHVTPVTLASAGKELVGRGRTAHVTSQESLVGLLRAPGRGLRELVVLTLQVEDRPYELAVLDAPCASFVMDAVTGIVWDRARVTEKFGVTPLQLPKLEALVGHEPGERPLVDDRDDPEKSDRHELKAG
jgi:hypothetical protein